MGLYERIKEEAAKKGYSINRLEKELGFPRSSISKYDKNKPGFDKISKIADFLGISIVYLLDGPMEYPVYYTNPETARLAQEMFEDPDMRSLFSMKRNMDPKQFRNYIDFMKAQYRLEHPED